MTKNNLDVGLVEDLVQHLMHLTAIEHHAKMSYYATGDKDQDELAKIARTQRSKWMEFIVRKDSKNQLWCETKHLLNTIITGIECSNRFHESNSLESKKQMDEDVKLLTGLLYELNNLQGGKK